MGSSLYTSVIQEGGDGDAIWYSRFYDINDIYKLVEEYNNKTPEPIWKLSIENGEIRWSDNQEWIIITNREFFYDPAKAIYNPVLQILL